MTVVLSVIMSCKKNKTNGINNNGFINYSNIDEFYIKNGVKSEYFTFNSLFGGTFTSSQSTTIIIQPNSFVDQSNNDVNGLITLEFKDIYKKSDMLLTNKPTNRFDNKPLKSAGMFLINVKKSTEDLKLKQNSKILIHQPFNGIPLDTLMSAFVLMPPFPDFPLNWVSNPTDTVLYNATGYIYTLYNFTFPSENGTWCNSDNPYFFQNFTQTTMTIHTTFDVNYPIQIYLIFHGINAIVSINPNGGFLNFIYNYAPVGLSCSIVAMGVKDGHLFAAFKDITISENFETDISLSEITTNDFINKLEALNN